MRNIIFSTLVICSSVFAETVKVDFMAVLSPINSGKVVSHSIGVIDSIDYSQEGNLVDGVFASLEHSIEDEKRLLVISQLKNLDKNIASFPSTIKIQKSFISVASEKSLHFSKSSNFTKFQKDDAELALLSSKLQLIKLENDLLQLKNSKSSLLTSKLDLSKIISDKQFSLSNKYLSKILISEGSSVQIGTPIAEFIDTSSAYLDIYIPQSTYDFITDKDIDFLISDKFNTFNLTPISIKAFDIIDSKHASSYKIRIFVQGYSNKDISRMFFIRISTENL